MVEINIETTGYLKAERLLLPREDRDPFLRHLDDAICARPD